jgi:hypothetical protein
MQRVVEVIMKRIISLAVLLLSLFGFEAIATENTTHSPVVNFPALHKPDQHDGMQQRWPEPVQSDINHQHWDAQHLDAERQMQQCPDGQQHRFDGSQSYY